MKEVDTKLHEDVEKTETRIVGSETQLQYGTSFLN
jgi:hypothetical protein